MSGRSVLLGWELGSRLGHAHKLKILAGALRRQGWRASFAFRFPEVAATLGIDPAGVIEAPRWPGPALALRSGADRRAATLTFGQILGTAGFHDRDQILARVGQWQEILRRTKPDLVISDYAPSLNLACRGHVPVVVVGSGFTVPPTGIPRYPRLHASADRPLFDELALAANVNHALARLAIPMIDALPEVMRGEAAALCTFPVLDPYRGFRGDGYCGAIEESLVELRREPGNAIFVYLQGQALENPGVEAALAGSSLAAIVYAPGTSGATLDRLRAVGCTILDSPASITGILPRLRAVVHHGGHGLACSALLAGRPQLVLSTHIENKLTGLAVEEVGLGRRLSLHVANPDAIGEALAQVSLDGQMYGDAQAVALAARHQWGAGGAAAVVALCEKLAG